VGDKTLYTMGALASRYRAGSLLIGGGIAVALKMLAGVTLGSFIARLPPWLVSAFSAVTFLSMAVAFYRRQSTPAPTESASPRSPGRGALAALAALLLTEWGDPGQLTAALFAARYQHHALIWLAASGAMFTKLVLSVTAGVGVRRWVPVRIMRPLAAGAFVAMALLAAFRVEV
jgi:putative Ca2+/H+ antiporter (TMEM165/GDT1 family)